MLASFATYVTLTEGTVRPELTASGPIAIKQGTHPLLTKLQPEVQFVANDTYLSPGNNFSIITGQVVKKEGASVLVVAHVFSRAEHGWQVDVHQASGFADHYGYCGGQLCLHKLIHCRHGKRTWAATFLLLGPLFA